MGNLIYPTLDLFVYHIRESLGDADSTIRANHAAFWANLPLLCQEFASTALEKEAETPDTRYLELFKNLDHSALKKSLELNSEQDSLLKSLELNSKQDSLLFEANIGYPVDGYYYPVRLSDTYGLLFDCSLSEQKEVKLVSYFADVKAKLASSIQQANLGKTWIISGFLPKGDEANAKSIAQDAYKALIPDEEAKIQESGEFLGAKVFEFWKTPHRWLDKKSIDKNIHVVIILYQNPDDLQAVMQKATGFYKDWMKLFCYRNKIIWAYGYSRLIKSHLQADFAQITSKQLPKQLTKLQEFLQDNAEAISKYSVNLNYLEIQLRTIETNLINYKKQLEYIAKKAKTETADDLKSFKDFIEIVQHNYQKQVKQDYASFSPGLRVLENLISTIRGIVEIEQAESDRRIETQNRDFQNFVAVVGVGVATASLTATAGAPVVQQITTPPTVQTTNTSSSSTPNTSTTSSPPIMWSIWGYFFLTCILMGVLASGGAFIWVKVRSRRRQK